MQSESESNHTSPLLYCPPTCLFACTECFPLTVTSHRCDTLDVKDSRARFTWICVGGLVTMLPWSALSKCVFYIYDYRGEERRRMKSPRFNMSRLLQRVQTSVKDIILFPLQLHIFPTSITVLHCHCSGICWKNLKMFHAKWIAAHFAEYKTGGLSVCPETRDSLGTARQREHFCVVKLISTLALQSPPPKRWHCYV